MSRVVVVFLFEFLPDFESALNRNIQDLMHQNVIVNTCDAVFANYTWHNINERVIRSKMSNDVGNTIVKSKNFMQKIWPQMFFPDSSQYNYHTVMSKNVLRSKYLENEKANDTSQYTPKYPESTPFLVAIFESYSNVTAQTCSATMLSKNWVVTAASCLEILPTFYNRTELKDTSRYTVVANALNPLIDGSVHNVTDIKLHPSYDSDNKKVPNFALMKIEPGITVNKMTILKAKPTDKVAVRVYGWELKRLEGQQIMKTAFIDAAVSIGNECESSYSTVEKKSLLCLTERYRNYLNINQMNSGGPVLVIDNGEIKMSAVAQVETNMPLAAVSLSPYSAWINKIIDN